MWVQPPFCSKASVRSNSAFVYCGSASMMSPANIGETGLLCPCQRPAAPAAVGAAQPLQLCVIGALHAEADAVHPGLPKANQCFGCHHIRGWPPA